MFIIVYFFRISISFASSTAQGGGGSFRDRKPKGGWFVGLQRRQRDPMTNQKAIGT